MGGIVDMVFGSNDKPPPAPDPYAVAGAQGEANAETARLTASLNRNNQTTPYGDLIWTDEGNDRWSQNVTLSPEMEGLLDKSIATQYGLTENTGQALQNVSNLFQSDAQPGAGSGDLKAAAPGTMFSTPDDFRGTIEDALYSRQASRLDPRFAQEQNRLETQLANQGITEGSAAYSTAIDNFGRTKNDAYDAAIRNSITGASDEMNRNMALELGAKTGDLGLRQGEFGLRQQELGAEQSQIGMNLQTRNQIMNELNALRTGTQVTNPTFAAQDTAVNVGSTPLADSVYKSYSGDIDAYNAQVSGQNAAMGGLASLGSAAIGAGAFEGMGAAGLAMFSDKQLKTNIKKVGQMLNGLNLYEFEYLWSPIKWVGVMAQEVLKVMPKAVSKASNFYKVNYKMLEDC